ncbi:MAG: hypothetical protein KY457_13765, partial [Actinobacteria bacterium]|nr:hypothetical protein [Actinomycetota bacterium]
ALHAWFDFHLKGMDVETGPAVEAFLNGDEAVALNKVLDPESEEWGREVYVADAWRHPGADRVGIWPDATTGELLVGERPTESGSASFSNGANALLAHAANGKVTFTSDPLTEDTVFVGLPRMALDVSLTTGQITHLVATLYRVDAEGDRQPMNYCAIQPQLRFGVHDVAPVVPGERMRTYPTCFTMAHQVPAGQSLVLEISTRSPHHASFGGTDGRITVFTGPHATRSLLPEVPDAILHDDVPLRAS